MKQVPSYLQVVCRRQDRDRQEAGARSGRILLVAALSQSYLSLACNVVDRERGYDPMILSQEVAAVGPLFRRKYRMSQDVFASLMDLMRPALRPRDERARRRHERGLPDWRAISKKTQTAVALRIFAGSSCLDVIGFHEIQPKSFYVIVKRVITAVNRFLRFSADLDEAAGQEHLSATLMEALLGSPLERWVFGALYGIAIRIRGPPSRLTITPLEFYGRKGFFILHVQAVCDARCRCIFVSTGAPGSMHDRTVWSRTSSSERLASGITLLGDRFIIFDDAYVA